MKLKPKPLLRYNKTCITSLVWAASFLLGLPCLSECGHFVLDLMDTYGTGMSVIIIAMFELIAIMWVYGVRTPKPYSVSLRAGISR